MEAVSRQFEQSLEAQLTIYSAFTSQPHRANTRVVLAELGSLSLEFTRLAQITKEPKYYDAIARITNDFEKWQNKTKLPGMWPISVDASGCKKPDYMFTTTVEHSILNGPQNPPAHVPQVPSTSSERLSTDPYVQTVADDKNSPASAASDLKRPTTHDASDLDKHDRASTGQNPVDISSKMEKRQLLATTLTNDSISTNSGTANTVTASETECEPQGLASPPKMGAETFTLGGMSDSIYEYLPKEYMLLGGLNDQYRTMFEQALNAVKKHLLFRPMIPNNRNVLFSGNVKSKGHPEVEDNIQLDPEGQHLTCFAGGMFAIGARIFDRPEDLEIAAKLTDGCVWAYESTATGIMPEKFSVVPCPDIDECRWNETLYMEALDPYRESRDRQRKEQKQLILAQQHEQDVRSDGLSGDAGMTLSTPLATATSMPEPTFGLSDPLAKRHLHHMDNDLPTAADPAAEAADGLNPMPVEKSSNADSTQGAGLRRPTHSIPKFVAIPTSAAIEGVSVPAPAYIPPPIFTHTEYVQTRIENERLPKGFTAVLSRKYILRPEAIESVFIMYRTTGDDYWREKGWQMFTAIQNYTRVEYGNSAITDVTSSAPTAADEMESFWLAETLKYFYLLFSDPELVSLDDYVL